MPSRVETRTCHVTKKPDEAYEFFLKLDESRHGQIITAVSGGGPADRAGLKDGDRIIKINGKNVENKSHQQIVSMIKASVPKNEITLDVVGENDDVNESTPRTNGSVSSDKEKKVLQPRLITLKKKNNSFGFQLENKGPGIPGHFMTDLTEGGAAEIAGFKDEDRIIEINGTKVEKLSHKKVVSLMKQSGDQVKLLVVDEATYKHFVARKMKIKAKHASTSSEEIRDRPNSSSSRGEKSRVKSTSSISSSIEGKARLIHVVKASDRGFGFFLRVKSNQKGEFIGNVESGKPGARCGLLDNDMVLSVNGKTILSMSHDDVVSLVKANPNHGVFLVGGPKAIENAKNKGLLSITKDAKKHILQKPRQVKLDKGDDGYGFYLKLNKSQRPLHIVTEIADDSPASRNGLKDGEVVVRVGINDVTRLSHDDCVKKIKESGDSVELTVGSYDTFEILYDLDVPINEDLLQNWPEMEALQVPDFSELDNFFKNPSLAAVSEVPKTVAKTVAETVAEAAAEEVSEENLIECKLKKIDGAFGFFLRDENGHFLGNIEKGGSADVGGVKDGDQIVKVNGTNVLHESHDDVVRRITSSGDEVTFFVRRSSKEPSTEETPKLEITVSSATIEKKEPVIQKPLPRLCELNRLPSGYGFHLNSVDESDRPGKYLTKVAGDGAADIAGVREGDRVIEVNDVNVVGKTHEEVVGFIRQYASKVTILVVDEEADRYYKNKGIAVTKALLVAAAVSDHKEDSRSNASSTIEAEATVHINADQESETDKEAVIDFPSPPSYEEKVDEETEQAEEEQNDTHDQEKENQVLEELHEIVEEIKEEVAEDIADEIAEDIKEEIAENIADKVEDHADEIAEESSESIADETAEESTKNIGEELKETVVEEAVETITDEIAERIAEKITEDLPEEIAEDVQEEIQEHIANEIQEEVKEEIENEVREAIVETIEDEVREVVQDQVQEEILDDAKDDISDGLKVGVAVAVADKLLEAEEESEAEETRHEIVEEVKESVEDYKVRLEKEMKEQMEREIKEKLEREMREKMEKEMKEKLISASNSKVPEPPPFLPSAIVANAIKEEVRQKSPTKKAAPVTFAPKFEQSVKVEDLAFAAKNLRSIKRVNQVQNKTQENDEPKEEVPKRPNFMSAKSMFEGGPQRQSFNQRPAWQRQVSSSIKQKAPEAAAPNPVTQAKPQANRATPWKKSGMSFKIVETSASFN